MARAVLKACIMKMPNSQGKPRPRRGIARKTTGIDSMNLPRLFLFLEVFVEKDLPISGK
jgi:hypothetical protein